MSEDVAGGGRGEGASQIIFLVCFLLFVCFQVVHKFKWMLSKGSWSTNLFLLCCVVFLMCLMFDVFVWAAAGATSNKGKDG